MLGVEQISTASDNFFYNEFISQVLFNRDGLDNKADPETKLKQCLQMLDKVAMVEIKLTSHDALRLRRYKNVRFSNVYRAIGKPLNIL